MDDWTPRELGRAVERIEREIQTKEARQVSKDAYDALQQRIEDLEEANRWLLRLMVSQGLVLLVGVATGIIVFLVTHHT